MPRNFALIQRGTLSLLLGLLATSFAQAAKPAAELVPNTTRGFLSIPDFQVIQASFEKTELGKLAETEEMKPFYEDIKEQLNEQVGQAGVRLGINWSQLADVVAGEVAIGVIEPERHNNQKHAVALIADVSGKDQAVQKLLKSIDNRMQKQRANRRQQNIRGTTLTTYDIPPQKRGRRGFSVSIFVYTFEDGSRQLVAADHPDVANDLLETIAVNVFNGSLASKESFQKVVARCTREANGLSPQAIWYIEPLGYARVTREALPKRKPRRNDVLKALEDQGFDALEAVGGFANLSTGQHELLVRAMVYAPGDPNLPQKFKLAARMMNDAKPVQGGVPNWVPHNVSGYHTLSWDIKKSFTHVGTLVDEIAGQVGFFQDVIESLKEDPNGPRIDIEKQVIAHLGDRVTLITDTTLPITIESERILVSISLSNPQAMEKGMNQIMESDPTAEKHLIEGQTVWLITAQEEEDIPGLDGGLDELEFNDDNDEEEDDPLISIADTALCIHDGNLIVSSHIEFIEELIKAAPRQQSELENATDFKAVNEELAKISPPNQATSLRSFTRIDDAVQGTYELFKHGRLPESKGLVGRLLNRIVDGDEKGELRQQKFNARKLPSFDELVRKHLGPAGATIQLDDEGLIITLISLKPLGRDQVPGAAVSTARVVD